MGALPDADSYDSCLSPVTGDGDISHLLTQGLAEITTQKSTLVQFY